MLVSNICVADSCIYVLTIQRGSLPFYLIQIIIVKQQRGQELRLRAVVQKGIDKPHVRWSPATTVTFMHEPEIYINEGIMGTLTLQI